MPNKFPKQNSLYSLSHSVSKSSDRQIDSVGLIWAKYEQFDLLLKKDLFVEKIPTQLPNPNSPILLNNPTFHALLTNQAYLGFFCPRFLWLHGKKASKYIVSRRVFLSRQPGMGGRKKLTRIFLPCCSVIFAVRLASMALCSSISPFSTVMFSFSLS